MNALIWYLSDAVMCQTFEGPEDYKWFPYEDTCDDDEDTVYLYGDGVVLGYSDGEGKTYGYGREYSDYPYLGELGTGSMFGVGNDGYPVNFED
jgi:hypothetical protein